VICDRCKIRIDGCTCAVAAARAEGVAAGLRMAAVEAARKAASEVKWRAKTLRVDGNLCLEDEMASDAREGTASDLAVWCEAAAKDAEAKR